MRGRMMTAAFASLALVGVACGNDGGSSAAPGETGEPAGIATELSDFDIVLGSATATAGEVRFEIHNGGPSLHELVVVRTDLAEDQLPLSADGTEVDEAQLDSPGEQEDIENGADATLSLNLEAGSYVLFCNIPAHYAAGMYASLTVT